VTKVLVDDRLILDTADYLGFASALLAGRDVNIEHSLQALRPSHGPVARLRSLIITLMWLGSFATFGGRYIYSVFAVGRKHTMKKSSGMILDSFSWPTKWVSIREDTNKPGRSRIENGIVYK
jgi:hypothetical protein